MSIRMMSLVWELDLPDSEKLVLLALADCANDEGHCWPGMKTLTGKCSKSDRTIQGCIRTLCAKGHLTRRETPGKGCNYTVHPIVRLGSNDYRHYLYKTTRSDTGEFYIGARSCYAEPSNDPYVGSGRWVQQQVAAGVPLQKEITAEYGSRDELAAAEQEAITERFDDPLCRNAKRSAPGSLPRMYAPEETAGRRDSGATGRARAPEAASGKPLRTIKGSEANASSLWHALPANWVPARSLSTNTQAMVENWPPGAFAAELESFQAWAANAKPEKGKGLKKDWDDAFGNWIRSAHRDRYSRLHGNVTSLRGTRPDPALDLLRAARAAEDREANRGAGTTLPALRSG